MKDAVLLLLCAVALAHGFEPETNQNARRCNCDPSEAQQICEENYGNDNVLIAHENCDKFYKCANGKPVAYRCPDNLLYNPFNEECDWPQNVECGDRPISDGNDNDDADCDGDGGPDSDSVGDGDNDSDDNNNEGTCNCDPSEAPYICAAEGSNGILIAHENCNQFYMCAEGRPVAFFCGPNLLYNPYNEECDWPQNVECGDRVIPDPDDNDTDNDNGNEDNDGNDNGDNDGTCNCNPEEAPAICAAPESDGVLVAHENCNQFYICNAGKPVAVTCPGTLLYNPYTEQCDWPRNVDCGDRVVPESDDDCSMCNDNDESGDIDSTPPPGDDAGGESDEIDTLPPPGDDAGNENDDIDALPPPGDDAGNENDDIDALPPPGDDAGNENDDIDALPQPDDDAGNDSGGSDNESGGNDNIGAGNCDPSEAPTICAEDGSDDILIAHENCNQFYICFGGKPVALKCPANLLFNPNTDRCDWPENVDCGDRVIPDVEDDTGNDNGSIEDLPPGGDDGGNDNDSIEDLPPGGDDGGNDSGSIEDLPPGGDDGGNDSGSIEDLPPGGDDAGNDSGSVDDNESGGNDNVGAGNCDPSEAPTICAEDDSDGVLVAHENCNQFYICVGGKPFALKCPANLLFNPNTDRCDWPENVDCGDRVIPDVEDDDNDNSGSDSDGNDNESGVNDNESGGNDNESGGNDNESGGIDNESGGNDNESDGTDNIGAGNCDPSEAPTICAEDNSDGVLVAHENCNQFYICSGGKPVALKCPANLLFNPNTDRCDWPENVDCGDRVIPDVEDDTGNDSGSIEDLPPGGDDGGNDSDSIEDLPPGGDDGGNDNESDGNDNEGGGNDNESGGNDNEGDGNDNVGAGNCDPSEAPTICAEDNSDGVLVAHENCNQFYICSGGKPVALKCPANLLFNPNTDRCDWPENVDCGDRLIPDVENDNNGNDNDGSDNESGGNDNGGTDNENDDNDNNDGGNDNVGAGNCDPSEAPTICAEDNSDGVLVAHENCNQFYICSGGKPVALKCPANLLFNPNTDRCDWPENVDCGDRLIPDVENDNNGNDNDGSDNESGGNDNGGTDNENDDNDGGNDNVGAGNCDPSEAPTICSEEDSDGVLVAHENCNQFYICSGGKPVALKCPANLLFNPNTDQCDWPENVDCGDRVIPDVEDDTGNDSGSIEDLPPGGDDGGNDSDSIEDLPPGGDDGGNDNESDGNDNESGGNDNEGDGNDNVGAGNCDPSEAPTICAEDDSDGVLVAHENCNQFYICVGGKPVALKCPANLLFNPNTDRCDWPENVDCGDRVIPDVENDNNGNDNDGNDNDGSDNESGGNDNGGSDNESGGNDNGGSDNESGGNDNGGTDNESDDNDNDDGGNDNVGAGNCDPSEAPTICAEDDSDGVLVAHENCNQFYICSGGKPVALKCPGNLLFNPNTDRCDWPENVDCGDRVIPDVENDTGNDSSSIEDLPPGGDDGGNDSGSIEDLPPGGDDGGNDSDSIEDLPPGGDDGGNDNDSIEDLPPGGDDGGNDSGSIEDLPPGGDDGGNDSGSIEDLPPGGDDGGNDSGSIEDLPPGGDDAGNDSGSIEDLPPGGDDAGNDSGNIEDSPPDGDGDGNENDNDDCDCHCICAIDGSDGELIAHEYCNHFYKCYNGRPVAFRCPSNLLYNPYTQECDWPANVECGDRVIPDPEDDNDSDDEDSKEVEDGDSDNDNGTCNCNPEEAPAICAAEGSDGVLIAHENCNQFYQCAYGKPVAITCPTNLLYNPFKEICDWPENVECGDRVIPDPEEDIDDNDSDGNDTDDNEGGIVNDDPSQAPSICADSESSGVLVAHENCELFYICSGGLPVTISCAQGLLYNPITQQCDWPRNVDCGDRIRPETEDDCPCNPRNAPALCSRPNSNGMLIAHENCNQFYICTEGVPLARYCAASLHYNIDKEVCDWPQNVDCNGRMLTYASLNKHLDSRQTISN